MIACPCQNGEAAVHLLCQQNTGDAVREGHLREGKLYGTFLFEGLVQPVAAADDKAQCRATTEGRLSQHP